MIPTPRVAIVTGAARGIGRATALRLASDGLDIVVNDIPSKAEELDTLVHEIHAKGRRGRAVLGDVSQEADVQNLVNTAVSEFGGLDVMVANAGIAPVGPIVSTSVDEWDRIQSVNSRSAFLCYRAAAAQMIKQGRGGRIIGACSGAGKRGLAEMSAYSASKFAVRGLTQAIAAELGAYEITVNAYAPGFVDTPIHQDIIDDRQKKGLQFIPKDPNYKTIQPEEIAGLVSYLIRDEARYITGQSVSIDGGILFD